MHLASPLELVLDRVNHHTSEWLSYETGEAVIKLAIINMIYVI